jgi:chromosome segregation ATPase
MKQENDHSENAGLQKEVKEAAVNQMIKESTINNIVEELKKANLAAESGKQNRENNPNNDNQALNQRWPEMSAEREESLKKVFSEIKGVVEKLRKDLDMVEGDLNQQTQQALQEYETNVSAGNQKDNSNSSTTSNSQLKNELEKLTEQRKELNEKYQELESHLQYARGEVSDYRQESGQQNNATADEIQRNLEGRLKELQERVGQVTEGQTNQQSQKNTVDVVNRIEQQQTESRRLLEQDWNPLGSENVDLKESFKQVVDASEKAKELLDQQVKAFVNKKDSTANVDEAFSQNYKQIEELLTQAVVEVETAFKEAQTNGRQFQQVVDELVNEGLLEKEARSDLDNLKNEQRIKTNVDNSKDLNVDVLTFKYKDAAAVRDANDVTGREAEAAHIQQQFLARLNADLVSARSSMATLMEPEVHQIFDQFWKKELTELRADQKKADDLTVGEWIRVNADFWEQKVNPALKNAGLEEFTAKQLSTFSEILMQELVIKANKQLKDKLIV